MNKVKPGGWFSLLFALALSCGPIAAVAQTTTTRDARQFEIISVDGNNLVVRDQKGTQEYTVPPDFRFTVDGQSTAVGDLKAGMKGTATITKTTTVRPVNVTTVKMGTVVSQTGRSITIKEDNGQVHRFTQGEADARGVQIVMDDKAVRIFNLNPGDKITATIITSGPPEILTAQQIDAELAAADAPAVMTADAGAATTEAPVAAPAPTPEKGRPNRWLWLLALIILGMVVWIIARDRPKKDGEK